ncbi:MAG: Vitamin B12 dependent methionine synthase activation subunit [Faecalibacterium sp.]|nr:Vitamin B12 dependent methionine synthase activation subunit [Ruminococcus sp.]MCM1391144.1 Vitamin B12 dependent methionine synthase activation subunit [Ruminococcus sp.]MCM1486232.1 Vitamin B12 dependent methionine synthase activation subunit [Faecalibacterium sp.]
MTANSIELRFASFDEVEINKAEALRYMGYKTKVPPDEIEGLFSLCMNLLRDAVSYKACFTKVPLKFLGDGKIDLGFDTVQSYNLEKNLTDCNMAYLFAATAGTAVDRLIMRYSRTEPSKSVVIDAIASAAVEGWCNKINAEMKQGFFSKPRFSPGYGDLKLEHQKDILSFLDAQRKIGITLSESFLMAPTKSVTAIVGIREEE